jgi:hypothetical protein
VRPIRAEARALLTDALRDAYCWQEQLIKDSSHTIAFHRHAREEDRALNPHDAVARLSSPALVMAAIEGWLSRGFGVKCLMGLPMGWSEQCSAPGLKAQT